MRHFLTFLILGSSIAAHSAGEPPRIPPQASACPLLFSTATFEEYWPIARRYEINGLALKASEARMLQHLYPVLAQSPRMQGPSPDLKNAFRDYSGALSMRVRGLRQLPAEFERRVAAELRLPLELIQNSTRAAAEDPLIYRGFGMAEFVMRGAPSIEAYLLGLLMKPEIAELKMVTLEREGGEISAPFVAGPRQVEMIRTVLQYSFTRPGDSLLEIGYGTPAVSLAVAHYTHSRVLAVDPLTPPANTNAILSPYRVETARGRFPNSAYAGQTVRERAPYSVIFALDTLRKRGGILKTDLPPALFVKEIYDLLADGGTLVVLNDFMDAPNFTHREALQAGFQVVHWGFRQPLPQELIRFIPYLTKEEAGQMALYVLRKGEPKVGIDRLVEKKADI